MTAMVIASCGHPAAIPVRDLDQISFDPRELFAAVAQLGVVELRGFLLLKLGVLMRGELPTGIAALARIARMSPRSFERAEDELGCFFDRDADGRWTDHQIARARDSHVSLPAGEQAQPRRLPDPTRTAVNRENGRAGGRVTQARRRGEGAAPYAVDAAATPVTQACSASGFASIDQANPLGFASSEPKQIGAALLDLASNSEANLLQQASKLASLEDGSSSKLASDGRARPSETEALGQANQQAIGQAKPPTQPVVASQTGGAVPTDAALVEAAWRACSGKANRAEIHVQLPAARAAMAEGLDFTLDIVPKIRSFARNKERVDNVFNRHILEDARALHASRTAPDLLAPAVDPGVWIVKGGPPYAAWCRREGKTSLVTWYDTKRHTEGCLRPTEWPPDG